MIFFLNYIKLKAASAEIFVKVKTADAKRSCSESLLGDNSEVNFVDVCISDL